MPLHEVTVKVIQYYRWGLVIGMSMLIQSPTAAPGSMPPSTWVRQTVQLIKREAFNSAKINWKSIDNEIKTDSFDVYATAYAYVRDVLSKLDDKHSSLVTKDDLLASQLNVYKYLGISIESNKVVSIKKISYASRAGLNIGDIIESVKVNDYDGNLEITIDRDSSLKKIIIENTFDASDAIRNTGEILYIGGNAYIPIIDYDKYQDAILKVLNSKNKTCGIIIDLRNNIGGNVYPMLAGVSPLFKEGVLFFFKSRDSEAKPVTLKSNGIYFGGELVAKLKRNATIGKQSNQPVALLIGRNTMSAGEILSTAFVSRPNTKSFGAATHGSLGYQSKFTLPDSSVLYLATGITLNNKGIPQLSSIIPDVSNENSAVDLAKSGFIVKEALV